MKKTIALRFSALLIVSPASYALTPWADGPAEIVIYTSGASVQDKAYEQAIKSTLAAPNSVDYFADAVDPSSTTVGGRWTAYYFKGNDSLGTNLAGKKIILEKRAQGSSGYGVIPLLANLPIEHLNISGTKVTDWVANGTTAGNWKAVISTKIDATTYLTKRVSDAGFSGNDPNILLKPGTLNYPTPVNQISTGAPEPNWPTKLTTVPTTGANAFTVLPTGGNIYGVAVTLDLYKVLQEAQKRTGTLSSAVTVGNYTESDMPSLNRNVIASIMAGKIGAWDQIEIVDKTASNTTKSLVTIGKELLDANKITSLPYKEAMTGNKLTPVAFATRNNGAAAAVVAYAKFLNYPTTPNAVAPATAVDNKDTVEAASLPIIKAPLSLGDAATLLKDWQNGANTIKMNNVSDTSNTAGGFAKRWGMNINSVDKNATVKPDGTGGDPWRYIRIDGYAPTLENVATGVYPYWTEGTLLYKTKNTSDKQWALKISLLQTLASSSSSPAVIGANITPQAWGKTGAFTTNSGTFETSIPFDPTNPVVPFTHKGADSLLHAEIVPVANDQAKNGLRLQLK